MNKIFEQAKDLHVKNYVVYGKAADKKLYCNLSGSTYSDQLKQAELEELFSKGLLIIVIGDEKYVPFAINGNKAIIPVKSGIGSDEFDAASTYAVGALCVKDGKVYKCKTQISVAAAWDASKWDEVVSLEWAEYSAKATAAN